MLQNSKMDKVRSPKISIIIPVYNKARYFKACLDSIVAQTFHDYEVVIVNDGSIDESGDIAESYAAKDARFSVCHQQNSGVTRARKNAVEKAIGDYILFVDGDDTLPNTSLEVFSRYVDKKWDIIIGHWWDLTDTFKNKIISIEDYRKRLIYKTIQVGACGKLIKRTLFDQSTFDIPRELRVGEDWSMHLRLSFNTERDVLMLPNHVYTYNLNDSSVTSSFIRDVQYEKLTYSVMVQSVPNCHASTYVPMITNAFMEKWAFYTKHMLVLSELAESFRQELKKNYRKGYPGLFFIDYLLLNYTNRVIRIILLVIYRSVIGFRPLEKRIIRKTRRILKKLRNR